MVLLAPRKSLASPTQASGVAATIKTGADFLNKVKLWDPLGDVKFVKSFEAWYDLAHATSLRHSLALRRFQECLKEQPHLQRMPLADALLSFLKIQKKNARSPWVPQTHFRELLNIHGAFAKLGKYSTNLDIRIQ